MVFRLSLVLAILAGHAFAQCGYGCTQYLKDTSAFYYLNTVSRESNNPYTVPEFEAVINGEKHTGKLQFNICDKVVKPAQCAGTEEESTGYFLVGEDKCFQLSAAKMTKWKISSLEGNKLPDGIKITTDNSSYKKLELEVEYKLICDKDARTPAIEAMQKGDIVHIQLKSETACGRDLLGPFPDLLSNPYIIYPAMIIIGLILAPFGIKVYRSILVFLGFIAGFGSTFILLCLMWRYDRMQGQETKLYIILGLSVAVGAIISYFTYAIKRVAIFILSCGLGIFIALQIYVFLAFYIASLRQLYVLIILCAVFGIFFGLISDYSEKVSVILSCAFGGAYLIVKGAGMLIKNYPDEFSLAERIKLHQFDDGLPVFYYVYLGIIVVLGISGSIIQFRLAKDMPSEVKEKDDSSYDDAYISIDQNDLSIDVPSRKSFKSTYRDTPSRARLN